MRAYLSVGFFVGVAFIPTLLYTFIFKTLYGRLVKGRLQGDSLFLICYCTLYTLYLIDIGLVTYMPVKFCGIIGQVGFSIAYLLIGNIAPWKLCVFSNVLYTLTACLSPTIENTFLPEYWPLEKVIRMPGDITIPAISFIMLGVTFINYVSSKLYKVNYENFSNLEYITTHDPLTGAFNRMSLNSEFLKNHFFIISDIDKFKLVNDNYGHIKGDECLKKLVEILNRHLDSDESVLRYGGEEFITKLNAKTQEEALRKAELLRGAVEFESVEVLPFTISIGLSFFKDTLSVEDNIKIADSYLYTSKENGRNQICTDCTCYRQGKVI